MHELSVGGGNLEGGITLPPYKNFNRTHTNLFNVIISLFLTEENRRKMRMTKRFK